MNTRRDFMKSAVGSVAIGGLISSSLLQAANSLNHKDTKDTDIDATEKQAKHEKNQLIEKYENELQRCEDVASLWKDKYHEFLIEQSLLEAAISV